MSLSKSRRYASAARGHFTAVDRRDEQTRHAIDLGLVDDARHRRNLFAERGTDGVAHERHGGAERDESLEPRRLEDLERNLDRGCQRSRLEEKGGGDDARPVAAREQPDARHTRELDEPVLPARSRCGAPQVGEAALEDLLRHEVDQILLALDVPIEAGRVHAEVRRKAAQAHLVEAVGIEQIQRGVHDELATLLECFRGAEPRATGARATCSGGPASHDVDN